jgi:hypothetical protein
VNNLRKVGAWLWDNKERMVLAVLFVVLCYRVYWVVYPPPVESARQFPAPGTQPPEGVPQPPAIPLPPVEPATDALVERNPFSVHDGAPPAAEQEPQIDLELVRTMRTGPNSARAQLIVDRQRTWVTEGEEVGGYRVERIDPDGDEVVVRSQREGRRFTLRVE